MKYFTETISADLAEKLKEKGMPYIEIDCETYDSGTEYQRDERWCNNTYAEVFDWLMEREIYITIELSQIIADLHIASIHKKCRYDSAEQGTWHEAATKAIEKALELI